MNQLLQEFRSDLLYAFRQFRRSPGFTATALITLTLAMGANTAIFTLVYGMLIKPLPVPHPEELYRIGDHFDCCFIGLSKDGDLDTFSYPNYLHVRSSTPEFQDLAAVQVIPSLFSVRRGNENTDTLPVRYTSGNYFLTFGVEPYIGTLFSDDNDQPEAAQVAVLSYDAWEKEFDRDKSVVGSTVLIENHPFHIIGVAQRGFFGEQISDIPSSIWIPIASASVIQDPAEISLTRVPGANWLWLVGRLRSGTDIDSLQKSISANLRQWLYATPEYFRNAPENKPRIPIAHVVITKVSTGIGTLVSNYGNGLKLLMMLASFVLLIACVNIANLLLVRGVAHRDYLILRLALGASRSRILRQMFTENILLTSCGGVLSLAFAYLGAYMALRVEFPTAYRLPINAQPTWVVIGFTFLVSLAVGLLFTLILAQMSFRSEPVQAIRGSLHTYRGFSLWPQRVMLLLQTSLCLGLLATAILAARSLHKIAYQKMGFESVNRYIVRIDGTGYGVPEEGAPNLSLRVVSGLRGLGGVSGVGLADYVPFDGEEIGTCVLLPDHPTLRGVTQCGIVWDRVSPDFLPALHVPILQGRTFTNSDRADSALVAIISQALAERLFPHGDALGRHVTLSSANAPTFEIVGVFQSFKFAADEPFLQLLLVPQQQAILPSAKPILRTILIRFNHEPENADQLLRRTIARVDPTLSVTSVHSMDQLIANSLSQQRLIAWLAVGFAALALTLAAVGLYGVTAYTVVQRTGEIGIRMALGSTRFGIIRLVIRGVLLYTGLGLLLGIPCALGAGYLIRDQLYELHWYDPVSLISSILILSTCAVAAGLIPAYRAASIQPMQALRVE